jgi:hypothetical protein
MLGELAISPSALVVLVLGTCLACIYMVFFFGRRLQTSAYLRDSLIEGAKQQELKVLLRELRDKAMEGPLDPRYAPPDGYGSTRRLWDIELAGMLGEKVSPASWGRPDETPDEKAERLRRSEEFAKQQLAEKKWESEERVRYEALRQQVEAEAKKRAEKKVPRSIDISLLGGGWSFLLEFSTVIVIIFTVLILGILKILDGKDISPIMAAIAGYVLGKATAGAAKQETPTSTQAPPK